MGVCWERHFLGNCWKHTKQQNKQAKGKKKMELVFGIIYALFTTINVLPYPGPDIANVSPNSTVGLICAACYREEIQYTPLNASFFNDGVESSTTSIRYFPPKFFFLLTCVKREDELYGAQGEFQTTSRKCEKR